MATSYRRIDTTDPRRHDRVRPLSFPASWEDDSVDGYGLVLSSATMMSGAAMVTRITPLAFAALLFALANYVHDKPLQAKKEAARSQTGPVMGVLFALASVMLITVQKLMGSHNLGYQLAQRGAQKTAGVKGK